MTTNSNSRRVPIRLGVKTGQILSAHARVCSRGVLLLALIATAFAPLHMLLDYIGLLLGRYTASSAMLSLAFPLTRLFFIATLFAAPQAVVTPGVSALLRGEDADPARHFREGLQAAVRNVGLAPRVGVVVWLWSFLLGVGAVIGIRQTYFAVPLAVLGESSTGREALRESSRASKPHSGKILLFTLAFAIASALAAGVGSGIANSWFEAATEGQDTWNHVLWFAVFAVASGVSMALLTTIWAALTSTFTICLFETGRAEDVQGLEDVF